ncbi:uncharacterized protein LOC105393004 [Plutella xylostella]|uniref:uncharacterized protein LOC105393004 n=1 Tax=Plutella xylostella TaxID=51655 RepID=UPI0020325332|nr:uncharacterized protein LOC105393004 [Plutella xylostella]XP_037972160.2 uncharacterized protein LOC105393004 [Plutella xylostella]XP_048479981.1 uncharacterized protein LOC105393004 [Plutella xylostella]XP_048479982.1 uncharacterized protein LOC105393004 [Plutella xylostella]
MAESSSVDESVADVVKRASELTVLSFRKLDDVKRLARHFRGLLDHPDTQKNATVLRYLNNLDQTHKAIYTQKREGVEVEYIFTTEKKSSLQRQRFNSLPVSEVPDLLKNELQVSDNAKQVHICTDCNVEIELNDEEPLMESLQKHFNLEVHLPKLKRDSIDVSEPFELPKMSRRLSSMGCGEISPAHMERIVAMVKPTEKVERTLLAKLEAALVRHLPDNSEASINAAVKFYQGAYEKLCQEVTSIDFAPLTSSVAPIIMSIKDNVNQNFASDANKNYDNEETEPSEKPAKNQVKKYRYYGPIENFIVKLLMNHKLLALVDDRTGKPAFFCMACEYYTLRFRYDSVLAHIFSETHIHNLACIVQADKHIPFCTDDRSIEKIKEMNKKFLLNHSITEDDKGFNCGLCKLTLDAPEAAIFHILDENHLGKMSDRLYRKAKANNPDGPMPEEWGPKSPDWAKFLAGTGKPLTHRDHVVVENFIKPSGKISNYCSCCDMTLKGPRQVLFNHIRQKKHLRNAAPHKLAMLYRNHCRPSEFYASFGNYYLCALCPNHVALPSFAAIVEHFESTMHIETMAKLIRAALYSEDKNIDQNLLSAHLETTPELKCKFCDEGFEDMTEAVQHILSSVQHQNAVAVAKYSANKGDIISVYMSGHYILHNEGATFTCASCKGMFTSIRPLLNHLVYADHFANKPTSENVFRFYLELKHNINMWGRNKYVYYDFGKLKCGVCDGDIDQEENAKNHIVSSRHRENMGASYSVNLDVPGME